MVAMRSSFQLYRGSKAGNGGQRNRPLLVETAEMQPPGTAQKRRELPITTSPEGLRQPRDDGSPADSHTGARPCSVSSLFQRSRSSLAKRTRAKQSQIVTSALILLRSILLSSSYVGVACPRNPLRQGFAGQERGHGTRQSEIDIQKTPGWGDLGGEATYQPGWVTLPGCERQCNGAVNPL